MIIIVLLFDKKGRVSATHTGHPICSWSRICTIHPQYKNSSDRVRKNVLENSYTISSVEPIRSGKEIHKSPLPTHPSIHPRTHTDDAMITKLIRKLRPEPSGAKVADGLNIARHNQKLTIEDSEKSLPLSSFPEASSSSSEEEEEPRIQAQEEEGGEELMSNSRSISEELKSSGTKVAGEDGLDATRHAQKLTSATTEDSEDSRILPSSPVEASEETSKAAVQEEEEEEPKLGQQEQNSDSLLLSADNSPSSESSVIEPDTSAEPSTTSSSAAAAAVPPSSPTLSSSSRKVRFEKVQIREYPICIGDNPSSAQGPPLSIEWNHVDEQEYELPNNYVDMKKRTLGEMNVSALERKRILQDAGYSTKEINRELKKVNRARAKRRRTVGRLQLFKLQDRFERFRRAICNATFRRNKKQNEREYLNSSSLFQDKKKKNQTTTPMDEKELSKRGRRIILVDDSNSTKSTKSSSNSEPVEGILLSQ
eukprot:scaffold1016_cov105-Cylindrotheca_fusiformis.AAC.3